ncbi:MAG: thiamine phosphate synthase [Candidatus Omnitrophota bacterium]
MINWNLYVIIDRETTKNKDPLDIATAAVAGGCDVIQLRDKVSFAKTVLKTAYSLRVLTRRANIQFIVNDRVDIALAAEADGVHLGEDDLPIGAARKILGKNKIIGRTTHSLEEALAAQEGGADYVSAGPIYETALKPDLAARGLELIREFSKNIVIPFVAIGGINETNIGRVLEAGAEIIAVVRAVVAKNEVTLATSILQEKIRRHKEGLLR